MLIDDILQYFQENFNQYLIYVYQHLGLSIQAIGISCLIGIPLGYISHKHRKLSQMITLSSQALRIIPSFGWARRSIHRTRGRAPDRGRGCRHGPGLRQHSASLIAGMRGRSHDAPTRCKTPMARSPRRIRSRPAWTIPASGLEHAHLKDIGRAEYVGITDDEALAAFHRLCRTEASSRRSNRATRWPMR